MGRFELEDETNERVREEVMKFMEDLDEIKKAFSSIPGGQFSKLDPTLFFLWRLTR